MPTWKLSASNLGWTEEEDERAWGLMKSLGCRGLEIAPTRVFPQRPYTRLADAARFAEDMYRRYGFEIPSMQSIWYGQQGSVFDPGQAEALLDYTVQAFDFARACRCKSLVFGCPRNRSVPPGHRSEEADGFFRRLGEQAACRGVVLALEANPPIYNTNFLNTTAQAAALVRRLGAPGLAVNLDVGALIANGESPADLAGLMGLVSHVHISRPGLAPVGPHPVDRALALVLKEVNYRGFVSLEMKAAGLEALRASLSYMAEVFG